MCVLYSRRLMSVLLQEVQTALQKNCGSRFPFSAVITPNVGQSVCVWHSLIIYNESLDTRGKGDVVYSRLNFVTQTHSVVLVCRNIGSRWALEQAKYNLINEYLLVGVTEELEDFVMMLEAALPRFFRGATELYRTGTLWSGVGQAFKYTTLNV